MTALSPGSSAMSENGLGKMTLPRRGFIASAAAITVGTTTVLASDGPAAERVVRISPVSGTVSYLLSVNGELRAAKSLCEASDRQMGATAFGRLLDGDMDEYYTSGQITKVWSTGDVRITVDGKVWSETTSPGAPAGNTAAPIKHG